MAKAKSAIPSGYHTVTPTLTMDDAPKALAWYKQALGAEEISRNAGPDGKIMHAEIQIGDSRVIVNDAMMGAKGPQGYGGSPAGLMIYVADSDALYNRAVAAGATAQMPMADMFWGDRFGMLVDPFGYRWSIATHLEDLTPDELEQRQAVWMKQFAASGGKP